MSVIVLRGEDWEGLYVDGLLKHEGHTLEEGQQRVTWFLEASKNHNFALEDIKYRYLDNAEDEQMTDDAGSFPLHLDAFKGDYS